MDGRVRFCGVDLGSHFVHLACLVGRSPGESELLTASAPAPGPWADRCPDAAALGAALAGLVAGLEGERGPEAGPAPDWPRTGLRRVPAAVSVPTGALVIKTVHLPLLSPRERCEALYLEMGRLSSVDPAETVGDWLPLTARDGDAVQNVQGHLLLMARQATVDTIACALRAVRMRAAAVEPEPAALVRLALLLAEPGSEDAEVLIDLGAAGTRLVVTRRGGLLLFRDLPVGGSDLTAALAVRRQLPAKEAEALKCTEYQEADSLQDFGAPGERLVREVERSLRYVEREHGLEGYGALHLVGGGARWPLLRRTVEAAVGVAARDRVALPVGTVPPDLAEAAALALWGRTPHTRPEPAIADGKEGAR